MPSDAGDRAACACGGWREEDLDPFADFCASEATARFIGGPCSREDAWRRIAIQIGHWALRGYGSWVLEEKASGDWVGYSGLWRPDGWPEPEIMWGLAADAQGRGYATEAAQRARAIRLRRARLDHGDQLHRRRKICPRSASPSASAPSARAAWSCADPRSASTAIRAARP